MPVDPNLPVELIVKSVVIVRGNQYHPGVYRPGELPEQLLNDNYCRNVTATVNDFGVAEIEIPPVPEVTISIPPPAVSKAIEVEKIDINQADINKIIEVQGIGTATANKIVVERDTNGEFKDLTDLLNRVKGLTNITTVLENRFSFGG